MSATTLEEQLRAIHLAALAASLPREYRWLDAAAVGALMGGKSARTVLENYACLPDFPKPSRPNGGHPIWKASEIDAWIEAKRRAA